MNAMVEQPRDPLVLLRDILRSHLNYKLDPSRATVLMLEGYAIKMIEERQRQKVRTPVQTVTREVPLDEVRAMAREFIAGRAALSPEQVQTIACTALCLLDSKVQA